MTEAPQESRDELAELAEGYPTFTEVLARLGSDEKLPNVGVRRMELNTFANGDITYNVHLVGRDEPEGNYLASS